MIEWKQYTGSDEQIKEMYASDYGYIIRTASGQEIESHHEDAFDKFGSSITHYLICNPHPYAKEISQWGYTGQPVYWRSIKNGGTGECHEYFPPFAHPNEFEYSFTQFED